MGEDPAQREWAAWRFPTQANPHIARAEIEALRAALPLRAYEQEMEARFIEEVTGALWKYGQIEALRVASTGELARLVVAIDPAVSAHASSDETGIIACGVDRRSPAHGYVLADASGTYSPDRWARAAIALYRSLAADCIVAEANQGGEMVAFTLKTVDP